MNIKDIFPGPLKTAGDQGLFAQWVAKTLLPQENGRVPHEEIDPWSIS